MGWASGSSLFSEVIEAVRKHVPDQGTREALYLDLVEAFRGADWDTLDECLGADPAYDAVYERIYPSGGD